MKRQKNLLPPISIIIVTLNCENVLPECLKRIALQNYPRGKLEILIVDGGSTDKTLAIARRSKLPLRIVAGGYRNNQEARRSIGFTEAKNEILTYIDSDNYLPSKNWLREMVRPFLENNDLVGTQTWRYAYKASVSLLNRYFALLGANDPVAFYLKKSDRLSWAFEKWNLCGRMIKDYKKYFIIEFDLDCFPTLGCNGFLTRKSLLEKARSDPADFFHTDVLYDLAKMGWNKYGIVRNDIYHNTGSDVFNLFRRRLAYMRLHHQKKASRRRYKVFDSSKEEDVFNLIKYIIFSLTLIKPFYDAFRGYRKRKDFAWFLHPFMCLGMLFVYSVAILTGSSKRGMKT